MKRLLSGFLISMTLWMSTWLVTDIHVVHAQGKYLPHPLFSLAGASIPASGDRASHDSEHCHFCSYDHGGHVGAMALPVHFTPVLEIPPSAFADSYLARFSPLNHPPGLRPPIV